MTQYRTIRDLGPLDGKIGLVRADLNVPMVDGQVREDSRLRAVVPTVQALRQAGARVVLMSHFGRPKGQRVADMSLEPLVQPLAALLDEPVAFASDCIGPAAQTAVDGDTLILLLENLRFHKGEEADDPAFAAQLAALGDVYINDAFSAAHRAHASTHGLARLLPAAAGLSLAGELDALEQALGSPHPPVAALVGGAKVSTKLAVLENLVDRVEHLIIGGGMANTFLAAQGIDVKESLCEHDLTGTAKAILAAAEAAGCTVHLPTDGAIAKEFRANPPYRTGTVDSLTDEEMILDIGPNSVAALCTLLDKCRTLVWNGPLGAFEIDPFDAATVAVARKAADLTEAGQLLTVAGGGDTVAALAHAGVKDHFSHVSTAGGAFLEWMEGKILPGVAALAH